MTFSGKQRLEELIAGRPQWWASLMALLAKNPPAKQKAPVRFLGWEDPLEEGMATHSSTLVWRILMNRGPWRATVHGVTKNQTQLTTTHSTAQISEVKNPPAKQETQVRSLGREDPLEKENATHSSILAWEIPCTEEPGGL